VDGARWAAAAVTRPVGRLLYSRRWARWLSEWHGSRLVGSTSGMLLADGSSPRSSWYYRLGTPPGLQGGRVFLGCLLQARKVGHVSRSGSGRGRASDSRKQTSATAGPAAFQAIWGVPSCKTIKAGLLTAARAGGAGYLGHTSLARGQYWVKTRPGL
jgi:hypothetical protein